MPLIPQSIHKRAHAEPTKHEKRFCFRPHEYRPLHLTGESGGSAYAYEMRLMGVAGILTLLDAVKLTASSSYIERNYDQQCTGFVLLLYVTEF